MSEREPRLRAMDVVASLVRETQAPDCNWNVVARDAQRLVHLANLARRDPPAALHPADKEAETSHE